MCMLSHVRLFATRWTVARQAPLSMGFPRQEHEWVATSFSRGSSRPRDRTRVSCTAGGVFIPEPPGKPQGEGRDVATEHEAGATLTFQHTWAQTGVTHTLASTTSRRTTKLAFPFQALLTGSSSHRFCPQRSLIWLKTL